MRHVDNSASPRISEDKARALVRDIIVNDFKQKVDDSVISDVAAKMLKALPKVKDGATKTLP